MSRWLPRTGAVHPSLLAYPYELCDGDSVRYEFLFDPDTALTHPALVVAFSCWRQTGYYPYRKRERRRAVRRSPFRARTGSAARPGPATAQTRRVEFGRDVGQSGFVKLVLNGQTIFRSKIGPVVDTRFGLFHFRDRTAARVRSAVLHVAGLTPAASVLSDLTARPEAGSTVPDRQVRRAWVGERVLRRNARSVLERARGLTPTERYEALAWVLPEDGAITPRLEGDFGPADPVAGSPEPPVPEPAATRSFRLWRLSRPLSHWLVSMS